MKKIVNFLKNALKDYVEFCAKYGQPMHIL